MKKLLVLIFLISAIQVRAQLTMTDVIRLSRMHYNAYDINARSFIDAKDSLQLKGYPLMRFESSTSASGDKYFTFYFQRSGNDKEKVVIRNQSVKVGGNLKNVFQTTVTTSDIDQFNAMLKNVMNHPDFEMGGPNLMLNAFVSKKSIGVAEQIIFSKGYTVSSNEINIQVPIVYTITFSREK